MFVTRERLKGSAIGPGDETFTVGRFISYHDESQSNSPMVRFGHISGSGTEFIERTDGRKQESFLVRAILSVVSAARRYLSGCLLSASCIPDPEAQSRFRRQVRSYPPASSP